MGKRRRRKATTPLTWKALKGFFRLLTQGILKASPLLVFGAIGLGIFWGIRENLYADPGFLIQRLEVVPEGILTQERFQELEKLYLNRNLFKVSPREVARQVEQDPRIQTARVARNLPRTLRIEVLDRDTFGQVRLSPQGPYYAVAADGVVLGNEPLRNKHLLLVEILEAQAGKLEKGRRVPSPGFKEAVALAKAFRTHPLGRSETIERIRLDHLGNVSLVLDRGPELRFGRDPMKKLQTLNSLIPLLRGVERNQIIYIELQYLDLIVRKK